MMPAVRQSFRSLSRRNASTYPFPGIDEAKHTSLLICIDVWARLLESGWYAVAVKYKAVASPLKKSQGWVLDSVLYMYRCSYPLLSLGLLRTVYFHPRTYPGDHSSMCINMYVGTRSCRYLDLISPDIYSSGKEGNWQLKSDITPYHPIPLQIFWWFELTNHIVRGLGCLPLCPLYGILDTWYC